VKASRVVVGVVALIVIAALLLSLGGPSAPQQTSENVEDIIENHQAGGSFEVDHWWTIDVEELGFNAARDGMEDQYPNVSFTAVPVPGGAGGNMPPKILPQLMAGRAPESFQSHPGYETATYLGYLRSLNDVWEYDNLEERTPEIVRSACRIGDDYYIVPIGVHRTNVVWYNRQLFDEAGIAPPEGGITWDEFWDLCDELQSRLPPGTYVLDLGDGMGTAWAATQVFETIMAGYDLQTYEDFINGRVTAEQLKPVLGLFKKFLSYVPDDHLSRNWAEACGWVYNRKAAMYLHGDWAKAYFKNRNWEYGVEYGSFPAPGTSGLFGLCVDGFVVPEEAGDEGSALRWVHSYTTRDVQEEFNLVKGSVSPYSDIPLDIYEDDYSREAAQLLHDPSTKFYPSITHGIAVPNDVLYSLHPKISEFVNNRDVDATAQEIAAVLSGGRYTIEWDL